MPRTRGAVATNHRDARIAADQFCSRYPAATTADLARHLLSLDLPADQAVPPDRTLGRWLREFAKAAGNRGPEWSLEVSDDPDEARFVLPLLAVRLQSDRGHRGPLIDRDEACWIAKVARAAPELQKPENAEYLLAFGLTYAFVARRQLPIADLDLVLSCAPWRDAGALYAELLRSGLIGTNRAATARYLAFATGHLMGELVPEATKAWTHTAAFREFADGFDPEEDAS